MNDIELGKVLDTALKVGLFERDDLYLFDTKLAWQISNEAHVRDPQRTMVFAALEAHPDVAGLLGKYLNSGLNAPQFTAQTLGDWLLTRASRIGPESTVTELRAFIDSPHCNVVEHLAFSGLEVDKPIALSPTIELLPMSSVPESVLTISLVDPEWFYYGRDARGYVKRKTAQVLAIFGKSTWHLNPHLATAVLRVRHKTNPKMVPATVELPNSMEAMMEALLVIAAATGTAMFPVAHWMSPTPETPIWEHFSWMFWSHLNALRPFATTAGQAEAILAAANAWEKFPSPLKKKLRVPLERLNRALAAPSPIDCAIDLGVALEALLLGDLAPNDQISLAFRLRGAWLLGANPAERKEYAKQFNAIYTCRSVAVHAGTLPTDGFTVDSNKISADEFIMKQARQLAAKAILRVIHGSGIPDWSLLVLGV
jgi:hypothetical protein